jgi:hypothetical protein
MMINCASRLLMSFTHELADGLTLPITSTLATSKLILAIQE